MNEQTQKELQEIITNQRRKLTELSHALGQRVTLKLENETLKKALAEQQGKLDDCRELIAILEVKNESLKKSLGKLKAIISLVAEKLEKGKT